MQRLHSRRRRSSRVSIIRMSSWSQQGQITVAVVPFDLGALFALPRWRAAAGPDAYDTRLRTKNTPYSDGTGSHCGTAASASACGSQNLTRRAASARACDWRSAGRFVRIRRRSRRKEGSSFAADSPAGTIFETSAATSVRGIAGRAAEGRFGRADDLAPFTSATTSVVPFRRDARPAYQVAEKCDLVSAPKTVGNDLAAFQRSRPFEQEAFVAGQYSPLVDEAASMGLALAFRHFWSPQDGEIERRLKRGCDCSLRRQHYDAWPGVRCRSAGTIDCGRPFVRKPAGERSRLHLGVVPSPRCAFRRRLVIDQ